jgi:hypothetical protein
VEANPDVCGMIGYFTVAGKKQKRTLCVFFVWALI